MIITKGLGKTVVLREVAPGRAELRAFSDTSIDGGAQLVAPTDRAKVIAEVAARGFEMVLVRDGSRMYTMEVALLTGRPKPAAEPARKPAAPAIKLAI